MAIICHKFFFPKKNENTAVSQCFASNADAQKSCKIWVINAFFLEVMMFVATLAENFARVLFMLNLPHTAPATKTTS